MTLALYKSSLSVAFSLSLTQIHDSPALSIFLLFSRLLALSRDRPLFLPRSHSFCLSISCTLSLCLSRVPLSHVHVVSPFSLFVTCMFTCLLARVSKKCRACSLHCSCALIISLCPKFTSPLRSLARCLMDCNMCTLNISIYITHTRTT